MFAGYALTSLYVVMALRRLLHVLSIPFLPADSPQSETVSGNVSDPILSQKVYGEFVVTYVTF